MMMFRSTHPPHRKRPGVVCRLLAVAIVGAAGCSGVPIKEEQPWASREYGSISDPRFGVYVTGRIDAVLGLPLVIPVELAGGYRTEDVGDVVLDDGRKLETRLRWIGIGLDEGGGSWLPPSGRWSALAPEQIAKDPAVKPGVGTWALVLDPPIDAVGQGLWIAGRRVRVNWLPDPVVVARRVSPRAWQSPLPPAMRESQRLRFIVETEQKSPMRRWRYRLMIGELSPRAVQRIVGLDGSVRRGSGSAVAWNSGVFADDVLETLAQQQEARWAIGLARLEQASDELAEQVRRRLCAVVDFGAGEVAPIWPIDQESLDRLLSDLLDQKLSPRERARRARVWLDDQPTSLAWVVSDAPRSSAVTGSPITTVAVANASFHSTLATVYNQSNSEESDLSTLPPLTARAFEVPSRSVGDASRLPAVVVRLDDRETVLSAGAAALRASPPGLRTGPLLADWSLSALLDGRARPASGGDAWATGALLYREPAGRWMLYVECASASPSTEGESLRLTLGAAGSSHDLVMSITPKGEASVELAPDSGPLASLEPIEPEFDVGVFPGGWFARVVLPEAALEADGKILRFGIEREDSLGRRSTWPRPMLPWQGSAPRAVVDLSGWDDLGGR